MFDYILNYLKNNSNKRLLVYYLEGYSRFTITDLAIFLNKNGIEVHRINKCLRFKNNSNEILFAGNIEHIRGYYIDDFIFFVYDYDFDNLSFIKSYITIVNPSFINYYRKNIILEKFFKKI